jgi:hypothetical protein
VAATPPSGGAGERWTTGEPAERAGSGFCKSVFASVEISIYCNSLPNIMWSPLFKAHLEAIARADSRGRWTHGAHRRFGMAFLAQSLGRLTESMR